MKGCFVLLLVLFAAAVAFGQELDVNTTRKWMLAVEELLTFTSIGQLKPEFTPTYLANRTDESVLQSQAARFRAKVARQLIECPTTQAIICIDPTMTSDKAVQLVLNEFKKLQFKVVWSKSEEACPSALVVELPPPMPTAAKE